MMKDSRFLSGICLSNDLLWENRTIDHRNTNHVRGLLWNCFLRWLETNINIPYVWKQGRQKKNKIIKIIKHLGFLKKDNAINIILCYWKYSTPFYFFFCYSITSLTHVQIFLNNGPIMGSLCFPLPTAWTEGRLKIDCNFLMGDGQLYG